MEIDGLKIRRSWYFEPFTIQKAFYLQNRNDHQMIGSARLYSPRLFIPHGFHVHFISNFFSFFDELSTLQAT